MAEEISPLENHGWWMEQLRKDAKANRPEPLRLAEALRNIAADTSLSDRYCEVMSEADDELRRLHAVNGELLEALKQAAEYLHDKSGCSWLRSDFQNGCRCSEDCSSIAIWKKARAAIARAEEKV
jgi:hypothetical protein